MKRTPIELDYSQYPDELHSFLRDVKVYDSSCSPEAKVIFIDHDGGYFLKSAPKGSLEKEAALTHFFHQKKLAASVLCYLSSDRDYLLTERVKGEDCTFAAYLEQPERLCDTFAEILRSLHSIDPSGCPVPNRMTEYLEMVDRNYHNGIFDASLFSDDLGYRSAEDAWQAVQEGKHLLKNDTLIHGDYCLPNLILDDFCFSGFIDLGNAGVGDRHVDLFWGAWTLRFNLKTDRYRDRFFDAYGRDMVNEDILKVIAASETFG